MTCEWYLLAGALSPAMPGLLGLLCSLILSVSLSPSHLLLLPTPTPPSPGSPSSLEGLGNEGIIPGHRHSRGRLLEGFLFNSLED